MGRGGRWWRLRRASAAVLLLALALTGAATSGTASLVSDQEHRLLQERANEVGLVLSTAISSVPATLSEQGGILLATHGSRSAYQQAAAGAVAAGPGESTFAWLRPAPSGSGFEVLAAAGPGLKAGQVVTGARVPALRQALHTRQMVATPIIGPRRVLGFALGPPAAPSGTVLYRESPLGAVSPPREAGSAPFSELDVVLYTARTPRPDQVLVTTTRRLPLHGDVRTQVVHAGATPWLLALSPRRPLVGSVAAAAPWTVLAGGIVGSLLAAAVIESAARRRDTAMALYAGEHRVAETLQRSLLPQLPELPGLDLAARYLASGEGQQVGGDWFDVFPIAGGRVGLAVGDVIGHDLAAASAMAQIRATLRAYALDGDLPAAVVARLARLVDALGLTQLVTVFYGILDPPTADGGRLLRYTNAGHLPPLVRRAAGQVESLSGGGSVVIGAPIASAHAQATRRLEPGSTLVLFTDGLVEAPGRSMDDGLRDLTATIVESGDVDAETLCDRVLATTPVESLRDDVALLAVRFTPSPQPAGDLPAPRADLVDDR